MPRLRVIVLEQTGPKLYRFALWADVPAARRALYAKVTSSVWAGATQDDHEALVSGSVVERVGTVEVAGGLAVIQADMQKLWQSFQDEVTTTNPWVRYGTTWDGATWTLTGIA